MKKALIIALFLLAGCDKKHLPMMSDTPAPSPKVVLIWGQSNAAYMDPAGHRGWLEARQAADTVINCAVPGARLDQFNESGAFFQGCVNKAQGYKIDVILAYQGESDANPAIGGSAFDYAQRFTAFIAQLRKHFGDVPVIFAQIGVVNHQTLPDFVNWDEVKHQQASVSAPKTVMIRTDDITAGNPLQGDGIHWQDAGYYEIGRRFAAAYNGGSL